MRQGWVALCNLVSYSFPMIKSFVHKGLEQFFTTGSVAGIQPMHAKRLRLILAQLDKRRERFRTWIPSLHLHVLKGKRKGIWAVTVQASWRVTFRFVEGDAEVVNYEDYH
jgi:proteic killer suppression protein